MLSWHSEISSASFRGLTSTTAAPYTESLLTSLMSTPIFPVPSINDSILQLAYGKENAKTYLDTASLFPTKIPPVAVGLIGIGALLMSKNEISLERLYELLAPSDQILQCIGEVVYVSHFAEIDPLKGIPQRKALLEKINQDETLKTALSLTFPDYLSSDINVLEEKISNLECPKIQLLAILISMNCKANASKLFLHMQNNLKFPVNRVQTVRRAFGRLTS